MRLSRKIIVATTVSFVTLRDAIRLPFATSARLALMRQTKKPPVCVGMILASHKQVKASGGDVMPVEGVAGRFRPEAAQGTRSFLDSGLLCGGRGERERLVDMDFAVADGFVAFDCVGFGCDVVGARFDAGDIGDAVRELVEVQHEGFAGFDA